MAKRKGKSVSFDAMVKFFIHNYNIPTTKDVEKLLSKLEKLEKTIKSLEVASGYRSGNRTAPRKNTGNGVSLLNASDTVLETIGKFKSGVGFVEIQQHTGFGEKKLRNIIYRLNNIGKITRITRGKYIVS